MVLIAYNHIYFLIMQKVLVVLILLVFYCQGMRSDLFDESIPKINYEKMARTQIHRPSRSDDLTTRFFVVGDFGDVTALDDLDKVTTLMNEFSSEEDYEFSITVGDNVYENGIVSMDNLTDVQSIMSKFKKDSLRNVPMYLTLGNHDCYSDINNEIQYSKFDSQWNFKSDYYELVVPLKDDPSKSLVLLMSNSCKLV